jgi:type IV fimbrial biogenesis protein FimT
VQPAAAAQARLHAGGLSLIELLVTIAVAVVMLGLGAPSMMEALRNNEVRAARDDLSAALQLAEIEAARRGSTVVLQRLTSCASTPAAANDWRCGYQLFADTNGDGTQQAGEATLKSVTMSGNLSFRHTAGGTDTVRMNAWGRPNGGRQRFVIRSGTGRSAAAATVCLNLGADVRSFKGDVPCP